MGVAQGRRSVQQAHHLFLKTSGDGGSYEDLWNGLRVRVGIHHGVGDIVFDEVTRVYDYYSQAHMNPKSRFVNRLTHLGFLRAYRATFYLCQVMLALSFVPLLHHLFIVPFDKVPSRVPHHHPTQSEANSSA